MWSDEGVRKAGKNFQYKTTPHWRGVFFLATLQDMLKKSHRLNRVEFAHLLTYGRRVSGTGFSLLYTTGNKEAKFSVVVGKKTAKKAVERNRLRRRVYAVCKEYEQQHENPHVAIFVYKNVKEMTYSELQNTLHSLFKRM